MALAVCAELFEIKFGHIWKYSKLMTVKDSCYNFLTHTTLFCIKM